MSVQDYYDILGVEPDAAIEEIKRAYRKAVIRWHPDISKAQPAESEVRFRLVTDAYKHVLRNALLAAGKARRARQVQVDSREPIHCGPHPDLQRFTPPKPSPLQRRCQTHPGYFRRQTFRHIGREIRLSMLAVACFILVIPIACIFLPYLQHVSRLSKMDPKDWAAYEEDIASREADRVEPSESENPHPSEEEIQRRRSKETPYGTLAICGLAAISLLAWFAFREIKGHHRF